MPAQIIRLHLAAAPGAEPPPVSRAEPAGPVDGASVGDRAPGVLPLADRRRIRPEDPPPDAA